MGFQIKNGKLKRYMEESGITEVVIPEGVTSIGGNAFYNCRSLKSITIPEGVISIGNDAFGNCSSGYLQIFSDNPVSELLQW